MVKDRLSYPAPARPRDRDDRRSALLAALGERILVLDGATGTAMQQFDLAAEDYGGDQYEGCHEALNVYRPDVVEKVHETYLKAGADIVETNSFGGTPLVLAEYGLAEQAFDLNRRSAELARTACARLSTPQRPRFVCGSMGPTTKAISVTGGTTFDELSDSFSTQALGLMAGGADYLLLETCQDMRNTKAGLIGIERAFSNAGWSLPVAVSATIETTGTMLAGQDAEALTISLAHADLLYIGLNCATGPEQMREHLRSLAELAQTRVACVPNAGMPDEEGCYNESPESLAAVIRSFADAGWLNLVGGCCGTTADHVTALASMAAGTEPRAVPFHQRCLVSGLEAVELSEQNRPLLVGERTNVLGSRKFKQMIAAGDYEGAAEVGRAQVRKGAQIIDICLQDPETDESVVMAAFLDRLTRMVKVPLMIDSTDPGVMETAISYCQGKAVLNSTNLEDGRERFEQVITLARRYGTAVVVGLIDEQGMAVTLERKLAVARRAYPILVDELGLPPEDIWWDALVFPCATGDQQYLGSPGQTVAAVRALKQEFPGTRTLLGVSNVSFGLPLAGRDVLNSVFLYYCTAAGLDAAIVNTQRLARYAEIPADERALAEALIELEPGDVAGGEKAVAALVDCFRDRKAKVKKEIVTEPDVGRRLSRAIVEGSKVGLEADLDLALADPRWPRPLEIINGPLMEGMAEVGRLFNDNQLIVAEVLQSAEVMKAAVSYLEPHMEQAEAANRGSVVLATVKGDVHDIGKNLVEIVLSNNGFKVTDLGIRVASESLIQAVREHQPDVIGLSGLLVKSTQQMVLTAGDLAAAGIETPLILGGAALTRRFTHRKVAASYPGLCTYSRDAMQGLDLVQRITDPGRRAELEEEVAAAVRKDCEAEARPVARKPSKTPRPRRDLQAPAPPDLERHVETLDLDQVWSLLNPQVLYGKHLGLRGSIRRLTADGDTRLAKLRVVIEELQEAGRNGAMSVRAVWQFFPARADGDCLTLLDPESGNQAASWVFPRQDGGDGLCLTDYILDDDHVALLVTTAGVGIRDQVEALKEAGEYLRSHALAALAIETAEAAAELLHARLRHDWGFPDPDGTTDRDRLAARYRGKRYSFGYPGCPDVDGQRQLFALLEPEEIGVRLTENDMMDPEASVSALVIQHPEARYL
jgi:5-methyltetrahydrofolate--homocysteine methyltransferase